MEYLENETTNPKVAVCDVGSYLAEESEAWEEIEDNLAESMIESGVRVGVYGAEEEDKYRFRFPLPASEELMFKFMKLEHPRQMKVAKKVRKRRGKANQVWDQLQ